MVLPHGIQRRQGDAPGVPGNRRRGSAAPLRRKPVGENRSDEHALAAKEVAIGIGDFGEGTDFRIACARTGFARLAADIAPLDRAADAKPLHR